MKMAWPTMKKEFVFGLVLGILTSTPAWALNAPFSKPYFEHSVKSDYIHQVYNQDQFNGNWKQLKGAIKENWGEFTDDDLLAIEGRADRFEGKVQERYGERKDEVREWVDKWLEEHPYEDHSVNR
jgi:uncharacterized protein YjbJ (UPF0337 family)